MTDWTAVTTSGYEVSDGASADDLVAELSAMLVRVVTAYYL
jgi:hypothetical protein